MALMDSRISALIRRARLERGLSQTALAYRVGTTPWRISRWETGQCRVGADLAVPLADALGIDVRCVLDGDSAQRAMETL